MNLPIFENPHLDGNSFSLDGNNKVGVLLFHGFTATTVEVRPLAEYLHKSGISATGPLLPGHGTIPEDAITVHRKDWIETAENVFKSLTKRYQKIVIGGTSMGGLLALHLAENYNNISGVVLFAPAMHIKGQWRAQFIAPFVKIVPKYYLSDSLTKADELPWQGYNVLPVPAVAQFYHLQKQIRRHLAKVSQPTLIFQGKKDRTINPEGASTLYEKITSFDKKLIWLENSGHTILLGEEREFVYQNTLKFIERVTN